MKKRFRFMCAIFALALCAAALQGGGIVTVRPIQVCDNAGANCANNAMTLFEAETDKIWAQAGIDISFLPWRTLNSTADLVLGVGGVNALFTGANKQADANALVISMWFVTSINDCGGMGPAFGCATISGNRIAIDNDVFTFNAGVGRLDTIAHEIGHSLGLDHAGTADFLMRGAGRTIPGAIGDINPDGAKLDKLSNAERATAMGDPKVVVTPEPASALFVLAGAGMLWLRRRCA